MASLGTVSKIAESCSCPGLDWSVMAVLLDTMHLLYQHYCVGHPDTVVRLGMGQRPDVCHATLEHMSFHTSCSIPWSQLHLPHTSTRPVNSLKAGVISLGASFAEVLISGGCECLLCSLYFDCRLWLFTGQPCSVTQGALSRGRQVAQDYLIGQAQRCRVMGLPSLLDPSRLHDCNTYPEICGVRVLAWE